MIANTQKLLYLSLATRRSWLGLSFMVFLFSLYRGVSSLSLPNSVNASSLRKLIASNIGKSIELDNLFASVEQDYGESAIHSVEFLCTNIDRKQNLIEIRYYWASENELPTAVSSKTLGEPARETPEGQLCDSGSIHIDVAGK